MKYRKFILAFLSPLVVLLLGVLQFNCSKDGPVGPQGPGPQGPAGPAGAVGSANVIYSAWFLTGSVVGIPTAMQVHLRRLCNV